jgi:hypothetical protein
MGEVIELGAHENMKPAEALSIAAREEWEHVLIIGFQKGDEHLSIRSSHMNNAMALWIVKLAEKQVFDDTLVPLDDL